MKSPSVGTTPSYEARCLSARRYLNDPVLTEPRGLDEWSPGQVVADPDLESKVDLPERSMAALVINLGSDDLTAETEPLDRGEMRRSGASCPLGGKPRELVRISPRDGVFDGVSGGSAAWPVAARRLL